MVIVSVGWTGLNVQGTSRAVDPSKRIEMVCPVAENWCYTQVS